MATVRIVRKKLTPAEVADKIYETAEDTKAKQAEPQADPTKYPADTPRYYIAAIYRELEAIRGYTDEDLELVLDQLRDGSESLGGMQILIDDINTNG